MFKLDATWSDKPPDDIKRLREAHLRPHMEAFFTWVDAEHEKVLNQRGPLRKALGHARRHKDALCRVLDDGRLIMDNNRSERELRVIAVGRNYAEPWIMRTCAATGMTALVIRARDRLAFAA